MAIVAEKYDFVVGVDTHSRIHTYAIVEATTGVRSAAKHSLLPNPG